LSAHGAGEEDARMIRIKLDGSIVSRNQAVLPTHVALIVDADTATAIYVDHDDVSYDSLDDLAQAHGLESLRIDQYTTPIEEAREGLTLAEAVEIARADASLLVLREVQS
jgi:hypothetical protein